MFRHVSIQCLFVSAGILVWGLDAKAEVVIETVPVGNPGNPGDTRYPWTHPYPYPPVTSFGGVAYAYNIGTFEVTAGQYRDFLNAVDSAGSNPYGLYNSDMDSFSMGCQITWNAGSSTYDFSGRPSGTESDWVARPVNCVSWGDAARFANWLHNGQPTGQLTGDPTQDVGLTEDGSYYLDGATSYGALIEIVREDDATWVIPSEDEWYKAAYYDGGSSVYYDYPTSTNAVPNNGNPGGDTGNSANFFQGDHTIGSPYWHTEVGYFGLSESPYATLDQGGNIWEWNEAVVGGSYRGLRGGSFINNDVLLHAAYRGSTHPLGGTYDVGFRVAEVSEQAALEGACCLPSGNCSVATEDNCVVGLSGAYQGDTTACQPLEACCLPDSSCQDLEPNCCAKLGGDPKGPGTGCMGIAACHFPDQTCVDMDQHCCLDQGGTAKPGEFCGGVEACCLPDDTCEEIDALVCVQKDGLPQGTGSVCEQPQACCLGNACEDLEPNCCLKNGGSPQGLGTACSVPEPCCLPDHTCTPMDPLCCTDQGGKLVTACPCGACCLKDAGGECVDDAVEEECPQARLKFFPGRGCDEISCDEIPIPTVSEWGLIVMTLLLLTGLKIKFSKRRAAA